MVVISNTVSGVTPRGADLRRAKQVVFAYRYFCWKNRMKEPQTQVTSHTPAFPTVKHTHSAVLSLFVFQLPVCV